MAEVESAQESVRESVRESQACTDHLDCSFEVHTGPLDRAWEPAWEAPSALARAWEPA